MAKFKYNGEFMIQQNVPIPNKSGGRKRSYKYEALIANMSKGDSVVLTLSKCGLLRKAAKDLGIKVTARRITAGDDYRVWRVS
jgi:ribosomal protein L13E